MTEMRSKTSIILDDEDLTHSSKKKAFFLLFFLSLICCGVYFFLLKEVSTLPEETVFAKAGFEKIHAEYVKHKAFWDDKKDEIVGLLEGHRKNASLYKEKLNLEAIPLEVILSYLSDELPALFQNDYEFSIFPILDEKREWKVICSKRDLTFWPLKVYLSMEVALENKPTPNFKISCLKRGQREIDFEKGSRYFGRELQILRPFIGYFSGPQSLQFYQTPHQVEPILSGADVRMNISYLQTQLI